MKTINTLFLLIAMLFSSSSLFAHDFEVDGVYYNITSSTEMTVEVTYKGYAYYQYSNEYTGRVSIPRIVKRGETMYRVTSIGDYAFYGCSGLTSVEIPNIVTSIGEGAFHGCSGLTSIEIPSSVTSIGWIAFYGCSGLTSVTIPNSVTSIGSYAFEGCSGITSVVIPNSVTSIGGYAFYKCSGLTSVVVEDGNSVYDSRNNCNAIIVSSSNTLILGCKSTNIPNSVTSIGDYAFYGCYGLTSIVIPNSVTSIGDNAFSDCI